MSRNPAIAALIILGGAILSGPRPIWSIFVASSGEQIKAAQNEWRKTDGGKGRFDLAPDDRDEYVLPPDASR